VNYDRGHWVSGRLGLATVAEVVAELSEKSGFDDSDVSDLHGAVKGYLITGTETARSSIQPLMMSHAFDSFEQGEEIVFQSRAQSNIRELSLDDVAVSDPDTTSIQFMRAQTTEAGDKVRVGFVAASGDYHKGASEAGLSRSYDPTVSEADLPMALTLGEGQAIADRLLAETHIARDQAHFSLPPSALDVSPGEVLRLPGAGERALFRVDSIEDKGIRNGDATRVEERVYQANVRVDPVLNRAYFPVAAPVYVEFLDLPLITGAENPHAPHVAASSVPWQGPMAVYVSADNQSYEFNTQIPAQSIMGTTQTSLGRAVSGLLMPGRQLRVKVPSGQLTSASSAALHNGANLAAIREPGAQNWELIQFLTAELIGFQEYELGGLLRGQFGTDGIMPDSHASGSDFVLLNGSAVQVDFGAADRGLEKHYRVGPANLGYDSPSYQYHVESFSGVGLRPYAPVQLVASTTASGDLEISWIRRDRLDADSWESAEIPLSEAQEIYAVEIWKDAGLLRSFSSSNNGAIYSATDQSTDGAVAPFEIRVAQISDAFGAGPFARIDYHG